MPRNYEIAGWLGMALLLTGYALFTLGILEGRIWIFHVINATGSIGILANAFKHRAYPSGVLNIIFFIFAIIGIVKFLL